MKEKPKCPKCGSEEIVNEVLAESTGSKSYISCSNCGFHQESGRIVLIAEIDINTGEVTVRPVSNDVWKDFGYYLEICSFMLKQASGATGKTVDELVEYTTDYLKRAADDYTVDT